MVKNSSIQAIGSALILFLWFTAIFTSGNALALSQVTATVDKNPALINESILLTVTADDDINRSALDTSPLLKDFIVSQTSVSSQTSMVNFNTTRLTTWKIVLIARRAGRLTIPALTINNYRSKPIALTVAKQTANATNKQADIFVTSELSSDSVYVQQLLTLTLKLHFSVDLKSGSLTEPNIEGAIVEKIGEDDQSDKLINGKRYRVIVQNYAITPEKSGDFIVEAPVFSGEVLQGSKRRSGFMSFSQSKPVSVLGKPLKLNVRPIPDNYPSGAEWLPTEILTLHQELSPTHGKFVAGEPITRKITLTAANLNEAQLPKLTMDNTQNLKVYPDQAVLHSGMSKGRPVSQKVQNFAIVPSTAGEFTLPEIEVTWFNTITNRVQKSTIPEETITVLPSENNYRGQTAPNVPAAITQPAQAHNTENTQHASGNAVAQDNSLQWTFLGLWLTTLLAWIFHVLYLKRTGISINNSASGKQKKPTNTADTYLALISACKKNDAEQSLNAVLPWLKDIIKQAYPKDVIHNTSQGQALLNNNEFNEALTHLQKFLYGKDTEQSLSDNPWQGTKLLEVVQLLNKNAMNVAKDNKALNLNP